MVSGATMSGHTSSSDQHHQSTMKITKSRKPTLLFAILLLLLANSVSAEERPKTIQQLRSQARSNEQYRPKVLAENIVMMAKASPVLAPVGVAVTEVYGNAKTQMVAPTNATISESQGAQRRSIPAAAASSENVWVSRIKRLIQSQGFQKMVMGNFVNPKTKAWLPTGNDLWDGIITDCVQNPSISCMQKNMYSYLDRTLISSDLNVTDNFLFIKNQVNYTDQLVRSNEIDDEDDHFESVTLTNDPESRSFADDAQRKNEDDTIEPESPMEEVTNALYGKSLKFAMTHDIQLKLPQMLFDGSILRISPRSFEGNGALVKIELQPDTTALQERHGSPRLLLKKIKKIFKNKLLLGFLAVVLVIKLIKIKLLWILPFLVGYGAAKKLILKVLLFFFPALAHIFKLCSWYHHNYHQSTKYHEHKHHINHLHTVVPPWFDQPHSGGPHTSHDSPTLIYTKPPTGHPSEYLHHGPPAFEHYPQDWELSGPGLGSEYISNRNDPKYEEPKDTGKWGLAATLPPSATSQSLHLNPFTQPPTSKYHVQNSVNIKSPTATRIVAQYQALPDPRQSGQNAAVDPFYSPILMKIDTIFAQLGIHDEPCKERLLCSMYKNPTQYSPHSNFISAELSRDQNELKKPANTNAAVARFYRYIQAARDGQEHRDCLSTYNLCNINTEQKRRKKR